MKTKFKSRLILLSLFTLLLNSAVFAQISSNEVDRLVEDAMEKFNVAGVAVGIVKDGKIIHTKGYGVVAQQAFNLMAAGSNPAEPAMFPTLGVLWIGTA